MKTRIIALIVGQYYTNVWLREQDNQKLEGYRTGAEQCLQDCSANSLLPKAGALLLLISTVCFLGYSKDFDSSNLIIALLFIITGTSLIVGAKKNRPGETSQKLAKAWKGIRKELVRLGIFKRIRLQTKGDSREYLDDVETRKLLVTALGVEMEAMFKELRKTEREGYPQKVALLEGKMRGLRTLTLALGISMNYSKYFFETNLPTGHVRIMHATDKIKIPIST